MKTTANSSTGSAGEGQPRSENLLLHRKPYYQRKNKSSAAIEEKTAPPLPPASHAHEATLENSRRVSFAAGDMRKIHSPSQQTLTASQRPQPESISQSELNKRTLAHLLQQNDDLRQQHVLLQHEHNALTQRCVDLEKQATLELQEKNRLIQESQHLRDQIAPILNKHNESSQKNIDLEKQHLLLQNEIKAASVKLITSESENKKLTEINSQYAVLLAQKDTVIAQLKRDIEELRKRSYQYSAPLPNNEGVIAQLRDAVAQLTATNSQHMAFLRQKDIVIGQLQRELQAATTRSQKDNPHYINKQYFNKTPSPALPPSSSSTPPLTASQAVTSSYSKGNSTSNIKQLEEQNSQSNTV